jgi:hypothetical protein
MARLLVGDEWYEAVAPGSYFEADYEAYLMQNADALFPGYYLCRFTQAVTSEHGTSKPDLALVDQEYREWWVVEVELGIHPLHGHVYEQIENFAGGFYDAEHAAALSRKEPRLDQARCHELVTKTQPRVLVLVNVPRPEWAVALARFDALVGVVEVFRSGQDRVVLRVNGEHPSAKAAELLSACRQGMLPNMLKLDSPAALSPLGDRIETVLASGGVAAWKIMRTKGDAWLVPEGRWPLPPGTTTADLSMTATGELALVYEIG